MLIDARVYDRKKTAILNIHPGDEKENIEKICEDLDLNLTFATKGELVPHQGIDVNSSNFVISSDCFLILPIHKYIDLF